MKLTLCPDDKTVIGVVDKNITQISIPNSITGNRMECV